MGLLSFKIFYSYLIEVLNLDMADKDGDRRFFPSLPLKNKETNPQDVGRNSESQPCPSVQPQVGLRGYVPVVVVHPTRMHSWPGPLLTSATIMMPCVGPALPTRVC